MQRRFSSTASSIGYEFAILIEARGSVGVDHPAFFNREEATWGAYYATVQFDHSDGRIKAEDGTVLGSWSAGRWYRIKVILNRQTNTYNVWFNGQLVGQNLRVSRTSTDRINAIALTSAWPGQKVYYDDVRVFAVQQQRVLGFTIRRRR
ncbi:MAG: hypothetical protein QXH32_05165 [Candidatus Caldarchaeum sp.]